MSDIEPTEKWPWPWPWHASPSVIVFHQRNYQAECWYMQQIITWTHTHAHAPLTNASHMHMFLITVWQSSQIWKKTSRQTHSSFFQSVLRWRVAVSTICRHSSRVVAFLQAVVRPKFRGPRSASIARSQVWLGLPTGRFQSGGTCRITTARARWWSSRGELRAIWPTSCRCLLVTKWESGEQHVVLLTSAFDTWRVYGVLKIDR